MLTQVTDEYRIHLCELSLDPMRLIGHPPFLHYWPMRCWLRWRTSMGSTCASWTWILSTWLASQLIIFDQWDVDLGDRRVRDPPVWAEPGCYPPDWPVCLSFLTNEMLTQVTDEYGIHLYELSLDPIPLIGQSSYHFWPMRCWLRWLTSTGSTCVSWAWILSAWLVILLFFLTNEMMTQVTDDYGIHLCELSLDPNHLIGHPPFLFDQ